MHDAIARWLAYRTELVRLDALAGATLRNQRKVAHLWQVELGEVELGQLRKSDVDLAVARLRPRRAPVTLQADVALLAQILNWCVDERLIAERPRLPTVSVPHTEDELPSDEAFLWVLRHVSPPRHAQSLEFMLLTGLSPHEVERLKPGDYDDERQAVGIGYREDFRVKTASRRRWVPLNARARKLWSHAPFPSTVATEKAIQRARGAGMPRGASAITPKMMRKWFSSKVAGDVAEHVLQRLLGHAPGSRITRRHYVRSNAVDAERAVDGLTLKELQ
jgi:integrase